MQVENDKGEANERIRGNAQHHDGRSDQGRQHEVFDAANSLREVPDGHLQYMQHDFLIKGVEGNGACFYLAITQELWGEDKEWKKLRKLCHGYQIEWLPEFYYDALEDSFPRTLIVGVGDKSWHPYIENAQQYLDFLASKDSQLAFVEMEFDMQTICDVFNVNLDIFSYTRDESRDPAYRQGWRKFRPNPNTVKLSRERISNIANHTIYLYYNEDNHFETLIARPYCSFQTNFQSRSTFDDPEAGYHSVPTPNFHPGAPHLYPEASYQSSSAANNHPKAGFQSDADHLHPEASYQSSPTDYANPEAGYQSRVAQLHPEAGYQSSFVDPVTGFQSGAPHLHQEASYQSFPSANFQSGAAHLPPGASFQSSPASNEHIRTDATNYQSSAASTQSGFPTSDTNLPHPHVRSRTPFSAHLHPAFRFPSPSTAHVSSLYQSSSNNGGPGDVFQFQSYSSSQPPVNPLGLDRWSSCSRVSNSGFESTS